RDKLVTGVQTCALPICGDAVAGLHAEVLQAAREAVDTAGDVAVGRAVGPLAVERDDLAAVVDGPQPVEDVPERDREVVLHQALRSEERRVGKEGECAVW